MNNNVLDQNDHYSLITHSSIRGITLEVLGPNLEREFSVPVQIYEKDLKRMLSSGIAYVDSRSTMLLTYHGSVVEKF